MSKPLTQIAPHTSIKGDLRLDGPGMIGGHVRGNLTSSDTLEIGPEGVVDGDIQGTSVAIHGTVKGNVVASVACRLGATARVAGDICAGELIMARGSRFIGQVCVGDDFAQPGAADAEARTDADSDASPAAQPVPQEPAAGMQFVEATVTRVEHVTPPPAPQPREVVTTMTVPGTPGVQVLTQAVQATLQRAPRIIKAR